jgi:hypothetical protein
MDDRDVQIATLIDKWGAPFARALAEFVRAASERGSPGVEGGQPGAINPSVDLVVREVTPAEAPAAYEHLRKVQAARASSKMGFVEFDPAVPAKTAGGRLKQIFKKRGIRQVDIARRLGVAPSVISRVFKHPERSRLQTIRNIADAAGISLSELV